MNTNIYSYLETSGGQGSNLYLNVAHFSIPELIRHLWQLKTIVFLRWCLIWAVLLNFTVFESSYNIDGATEKIHIIMKQHEI